MKNCKSWNNKEDEILKSLYGKISINQIIKDYLPTRTKSSIVYRIGILNLKSNRSLMMKLHGTKYSHNKNFFTNINSLSSYWAGFLAADGNISISKNRCRLNCTLKDGEHLEKFKKALNADNPIKKYHGYNIQTKNTIFYHLNIDVAYQLSEDLKKNFNVIPCKSLILEPPNLIDEDNICAFIRGYFDGDGYITQYHNNIQIGFTSTHKMVLWIQEKLIEYTNCKSGSIRFYRSSYTIRFSGNKNAILILKWLYKDSTYQDRLDRKYNNFLVYFPIDHDGQLNRF